MSTLGAYLQAEDVLLNLPVADKGSCFTPSACTSSASVAWHPEDVSSGLMRREQAGSTGLGLGMAVRTYYSGSGNTNRDKELKQLDFEDRAFHESRTD